MDILGINGVVYKGRLSSLAANRTITVGKDLRGRGAAPGHHISSSQAVQLPEPACPAHPKATKTTQPRSRHTTETRRAPKYSSHYVSPYSCECLPQLFPQATGPTMQAQPAAEHSRGHGAPRKAVCPSALQVLPHG